MLGSQPVRVLKDALQCHSDANLAAIGQQQPSSFIYIEGQFLWDERGADLSEPVRRHLKAKGMGPPPGPQPGSCEGRSPSTDTLPNGHTGVHVNSSGK